MSHLFDFITDPRGETMFSLYLPDGTPYVEAVIYSLTPEAPMSIGDRANLDAALAADGHVYALDYYGVPVAWRCDYLDDEYDAPDPRPVWQVSADAPDSVRRALHDADVRVLR